MIFLKTEKGPEKLSKWEEIICRPTFLEKLPKAEYKLSHIIGYYELKDEIHCALSSCNQPHAKGYIVVTDNGVETNIGHRCGRRIFGIEFDSHASDFDKYRDNEERKLAIIFAKTKLYDWTQSLESLRSGGKDILWVTIALEDILNSKYFGRVGALEMRSLARTQNPNVTVDMKVVDSKLKALLFKFNKAFRESGEALEEHSLGKVNNLHVLSSENNLKIMFSTAQDSIKQISACNIESAPSPELLAISQKSNTLENDIAKIHRIYKDALAFLSKKNLYPVLKKLEHMESVSTDDRVSFQDFLNQL
ncbi:TPA: hypothetical protein U5D71_003709 [Yersinia enterocolitica]|nr:hypothetical protein [Yersinia enterocolitica]